MRSFCPFGHVASQTHARPLASISHFPTGTGKADDVNSDKQNFARWSLNLST